MMATQEQLRDVELQKIADGSKAWNDAGRFGVDKGGKPVPIWNTEGITSNHALGVSGRIKDISTPEGIYQSSLSGSSTALEITENRFTVVMAQKTYKEIQSDALRDTVDVLVMESLGV